MGISTRYTTGKQWDIHILHNEDVWKFYKPINILYAHDSIELYNQINSACHRMWMWKFGGWYKKDTNLAYYQQDKADKFFSDNPQAGHFKEVLKTIPIISQRDMTYTCNWLTVKEILEKNYLKIIRQPDLDPKTMWSFNKVV